MMKEMKELGKVKQTTEDKVIIPVKQLPPFGGKVYNNEKREVGEIIDYIGSTKAPYAVISGTAKVGEELYLKG